MMAAHDIEFDPDFASPAQWAAMYRACGIQVLPARYPMLTKEDKRPALASWREFQDERLVSDGLFNQWFSATCKPNMGLVSGRASGNVVVIDLDVHEKDSARLWWQGVLIVHNANLEPETWSQRTGGGGRQLFFLAPPGWHAPTNRTPIGVDIRGQGGWAMLPPSIHMSGDAYAWEPGRAPWQTDMAMAPPWLLDAIDALVEQHGGDTGASSGGERTESPETDFNAFGARIDGREDALTKWVWRTVLELYRSYNGVMPEHQGKPEFEASLDKWLKATRTRIPGVENVEGLERECRGPSAFLAKWKRAVKKWDGEVARQAREERPRESESTTENGNSDFRSDFEQAEASASATPEGLFEYLDVKAIKAMADPEWLVEGLIVERGLGFIFGPPGCCKTFIALGMGLSLATGMPDWWNRRVEKQGVVIYISSEGQSDLKFRLQAWEKKHEILADEAPFYLIRQTINFMLADDVGRLLATVQAIADRAGEPIAAVYVDTVSRVLPGADENLQKDMTLFVAACDAVRQKFATTVIGVHHTNAAGNMRGSTVFPGAADFLVEVKREKGADHGSITATKVKSASDGWEQHFAVETIQLGDLNANSSLVAVASDAPPEPQPMGHGWPDRETCRRILAAADAAWACGNPWSSYPRSKTEGRYMPSHMAAFGVGSKLAQAMVETWLTNGVLVVETRDTKTKLKGLKVIPGMV